MYLTMSMMALVSSLQKKARKNIYLNILSQVMLHLRVVGEDMASTPAGQVYGEDIFPHSSAKCLILAQQKITGGDCGWTFANSVSAAFSPFCLWNWMFIWNAATSQQRRPMSYSPSYFPFCSSCCQPVCCPVEWLENIQALFLGMAWGLMVAKLWAHSPTAAKHCRMPWLISMLGWEVKAVPSWCATNWGLFQASQWNTCWNMGSDIWTNIV